MPPGLPTGVGTALVPIADAAIPSGESSIGTGFDYLFFPATPDFVIFMSACNTTSEFTPDEWRARARSRLASSAFPVAEQFAAETAPVDP